MRLITKIFMGIVLSTTLLGTSLSISTYAQQSPQTTEFDEVQAQIESKKFKEAVATTSAILKSNPRSATAFFLRGFAYIGLKDVNSAIVNLEKSASILDSEGKFEKAKEIRQIIAELQPSKL